MFGGMFILGALLVGVLVTNLQLVKQQDIRQHAATSTLGTVTVLNNSPINYHQLVQFNFTFPKPTKIYTVAVVCYQNSKRILVSENGYVDFQYDQQTKSGTFSWLVDSKSNTFNAINPDGSPLYPGFDYTIPANCQAYIIDEGSRNGKPSTFLTDVATFSVNP